MKEIDLEGLAHEIWATAQLIPGEGIEDGVQRIFDLLTGNFKKPPNQVNSTDKKPCCLLCASQHELKPYDKYCGKCGRVFDR